MATDLKAEIQEVKRKLKAWEGSFVKDHDRKPGKEDIAAAPEDIQGAYKQYAKLRSREVLERNKDAWGTELNKKAQEKTTSQEGSGKTSADGNASFMTKLSKKLHENETKLTKKPSWGLSRSFSQTPKADPSSGFSRSFSQTPKADSSSSKKSDSFFAEKIPPGNNLCEKENDSPLSEETDSDKLIATQSSFLSVLDKVSIKTKTASSISSEVVLPMSCSTQMDKKRLTEKYKFSDKLNEEEPILDLEIEPSEPFEDLSKTLAASEKVAKKQSICDTKSDTSTKTNQHSSTNDFDAIDINDFNDSFPEEKEALISNEISVTKSEKFSKKRKASDEPETDQPVPRKARRTRVTSTGSRSSRRKSQDENEEDWENAGASEVAWRPDEPCVNLEKDLEPQTMDKEEMAEEQDEGSVSKKTKSRSRGAAKPVSNDNFVRLNMKLKTYKRKGQAITGGKYKRMQWKQKMKARSESFGSDKCFKCGQPGHWANKCKAKGNASVPGMSMGKVTKNTVDDAEFLSLKEAVGMARGNKPKAAAKKTSKKAQDSSAATNEDPAPTDAAEEDQDELDVELEIYRHAYEAKEAPPPVDPLYQLNADGSLPEPTKEVMNALRMYGFDKFRPGQQKAVMRILCGLSTLVVMSTGSGKSLCYQLAAYLYATKMKAITLVISPLVSLMEDQVTGLPPGIKGACLHTNMSKVQRQRVIDAVAAGDVHFLLVSPEAMTSSSGSLMGTSQLPPIAFACIDEAHCVSEWSHHFRPSYLRICKVLREVYGVRCMLGLTATATLVTAASVSQHLGIDNYETSTIRDLPVPSNLLLSASRDEDKDQSLLGLLQGDRFSKCGSIIIYCTRREQTSRIATLIRTSFQNVKSMPDGVKKDDEEPPKKGKCKAKKPAKPVDPSAWTAECYHAGLSAAQRKKVQNAFMSGRLRVCVATVAFGMGVDKSDVRGIIHYTMPKSFESYVQEIGRAGRDGKPSHCHVFLDYRGGDVNELKRHIHANTIDRFVIKKFIKKCFPTCRCKDKFKAEEAAGTAVRHGKSQRICPGHERAIPIDKTVLELDIKEEGISTLLCYLELHPKEWLINLQSVYATCTVQCYGGPRQLHFIAKKCPPIAVAIAKQQKQGASFGSSNSIEFPVVEVSDAVGWESGPVKRELKLLQWNLQEGDGAPRKSGVIVTFTDLAFHAMSPGDLDDDEIDEIVDFLNERIQTQERTELGQLQRLEQTLKGVSHKDVYMCADQLDTDRSDKLKDSLRQYFDEQPEIRDGQVTMLSFAREYGSQDQASILEKVHCDYEEQVIADIRQFVHLYSNEHSLSGRVIARIFHGIPSPCFPSIVWGRVRRFWRCHLDVDFNVVRKLATQYLVNIR